MARSEIYTPVAERDKSNQTARILKEVSLTFDGLNIDYYIVGSLAVAAITGSPVIEEKDVDVLIPKQLNEAKNILAEKGILKTESNNSGVDLGINECIIFGEDGCVRLKFRKYEVEVPPKTFFGHKVNSFGVEVKTLPPETLFHLYLISGSFRHEDWVNVLQLGRWLRNHPNANFPESLYTNFHRYAKERQEKYPIDAFLWKMDKRRNIMRKPSVIRFVKDHCPYLKPYFVRGRNLCSNIIGRLSTY